MTKYDNFLATNSGKRLLDNHSLTEYGVWRIFGEDPNCDFGGSHHQPELGIVEGKLEDVIEHAVELNNFWTWGGGGSIVKQGKVLTVNAGTSAKRRRLQDEKRTLEEQLKKLNAELEELS